MRGVLTALAPTLGRKEAGELPAGPGLRSLAGGDTEPLPWTMRKLLTPVGLPALAVAALSLSTTALAHADRPLSNSYCKGPVAVAPDISATTCVYVTVSDA